VDGFGVFADFQQDGLPDGLAVFHGLNEAGKSTLLAFLRGVLFGFRDRRSKVGVYEPLYGGSHGGRVFLEVDGRTYTVEREAGRQRPARIMDAEGEELDEDLLRQFLGGADRTLFENVFAIGLRELQELDTLTREGVRDRIFSAAVAGAGRSARAAANDFGARAAQLFKLDPRAKKDEVSRIFGELREVDADLLDARDAARDYDRALAGEAEKEATVAEIRYAIERLRKEKARLDRLQGLWERWRARAAAVETLVETDSAIAADPAAPVLPDEDLERVACEASSLGETLATQQSELLRRPDADAARAEVERRLEQRLNELGAEWIRAELKTFVFPIPAREKIREWQEVLESVRSQLKEVENRARAAEDEKTGCGARLEEVEAELEKLGDPPPEVTELRKRTGSLEKLRAQLTDLAEARRNLEAREAPLHGKERELQEAEDAHRAHRAWPWAVSPALVLVLAVVLAVLSGGDPRVLAAAGVAAVIGVALGISQYRQHARRRGEIDGRIATLRRDVQVLKGDATTANDDVERRAATVSETARALGLPDPPSQADIAAARDEVDMRIDARRGWDRRKELRDEAASAASEASKKHDAAEEALAARREEVKARTEEWQVWRAEHGFPKSLSPAGVDDFAVALERAREALADLEGREAELRSIDETHERWAGAACAVLSKRGRQDIPETGLSLLETFEEELGAVKAELSARNTAVEVEEEIRGQAPGDPEETNSLRSALVSGNPDYWVARAQEVVNDIQRLEEERERAVEAALKAREVREELERGARIADLEMRREALVEEMRRRLEEWRRFKLAAALIEETLSRFAQEHQPAVLSHASEIFNRVTLGRYRSVRQRTDDEGFAVLNAEGRLLDPVTQLSRGTREQLYLCLRLGLAEAFSRHGATLLLILDDPLANFDAGRCMAIAAALAEVAEARQVLLFTCHNHVVETVKEVLPGVVVREIPRRPLSCDA
jgi:uncharacterized protein YhaN